MSSYSASEIFMIRVRTCASISIAYETTSVGLSEHRYYEIGPSLTEAISSFSQYWDTSDLNCPVESYLAIVGTSYDPHPSLYTQLYEDTVQVAVNPSLLFQEGYYTFRFKIDFVGGFSRIEAGGMQFYIHVECGAGSTTISFGDFPNNLGPKQYLEVGVGDNYYLPYPVSSLEVDHPGTSCVVTAV